MRAWQVGRRGEPGDVLELVEAAEPAPGPGEVTITVDAAAIGLPDVLMCRGSYPLSPDLPFTPGQEVSGVIRAVGDGLDASPGTPVMAVTRFGASQGGFAEIAVADWKDTFVIPDGFDRAAAAGFSVAYLTAWIGLVRRGGLMAGERVAVLGAAGGSGSAAVDLAAALDAEVIAVAGGDEKGHHVRRLGAAHVIDHQREDVTERLRELSGGRGVDVVFDAVGGDTSRSATAAMANEGRLLLIGFASGSWPRLSAQHAVGGNYSIVGAYVGAYDRAAKQAMVDNMAALHDDGSLSASVTRIHPFTDLVDGLNAVVQRQVIGRSVLAVSEAVENAGPRSS